jgi:hypothetical protein
MAQIRKALRAYYTDAVEFPATLQELASHRKLPAALLVSPWKKPFAYRAEAMRLAPDVPRQKYSLHCATLGTDRRKWADILNGAWSLQEEWVLRGVTPDEPRQAILIRAGAKRKWVRLATGERHEGVLAIEVAPKLVVLAHLERIAILTL